MKLSFSVFPIRLCRFVGVGGRCASNNYPMVIAALLRREPSFTQTNTEPAASFARLTYLRDLSREVALSEGPRQSISYRGLNSHERGELQELADYLVKIQAALGHARRVSRLIGSIDEEEKWNALLADCAAARDIAEQGYARRY